MDVAGILACLVGLTAWRRRLVPGRRGFAFLMLAIAVYSLFAALEISATTIPAKITWSKLSYLGVVNLAPCWLAFAFSYTQPKSPIPPRRLALLWIVPAITLVLAFTNEWHGLIWSSFTFESAEPGALLIYGHGTGFWLHAVYAYLLMLVGTYWFIRFAWHSPRLFKWQAVMVTIASLIPWAGNMLYIFNIEPWRGLDLTPLGFVLSGIFLLISLYLFRTFDLAPVARDIVFNSMGGGVLLLDNLNRLVDINPKAKEWTGLDEGAIGQDLFDILQLDDTVRQYEDTPEAQAVINIGEGQDLRIYQLTISPIYGPRGALQGRVVLFNDISEEHALLENKARRARQMSLLSSITQEALSADELPRMIQSLADHLGELFEADGAYLTLWDDERKRVIPSAAHGEMRESYPAVEILPGEKTMTESVLKAGHVLVVEDTFDTPYLSPRIAALFPTRSNMALPLIAHGKKLGAAIVSYHAIRQFSLEEIALGEQVAGQISLALEKAWMFDAERQRNAQLTALHAISQAIAASLELNKIFETVVNELNHAFGYRYASIYRLDGDTLKLQAQVGFPEESLRWEIPIQQGITGRAVRTRQPQYVKDVAADLDFLGGAYDVGSEICIPLLKDQSVLGTLNVESPPQRPLTEIDMQLLTTFASQVTVAIDNADLFTAEREHRELAEALREMGMAMSESLNLDSVLNRLLEEIQRVVLYDRACVMLVDEKLNRARVTNMRVLNQSNDKLLRKTVVLEFVIDQTPQLHQMVGSRKPLMIQDTSTGQDWANDLVSDDFRSFIGVPVILRHEVIGFLLLDKTETNFYQTGDGDTLAAFADQAAIAIENARNYADMEHAMEREHLLFTATRDFTSGLDAEAVLQTIVHHMVKALNVDGCTISRWDPAHDCVVTLLDYDTKHDVLPVPPGSIYSLRDYPLTRSVIENQHSVAINLNDDMVDPAERALLEMFGNQALLMLPLIVGRDKQVYGIVEIFRKMGEYPFTNSDLELAQSFLAQAAIAIENARLYTEAQRQAIVDELTGLYNRRGLFVLGKRELERAIRFNHPLTTLFLDIDHFKDFNDIYSYAVGDQVLCLFTECLLSNLREFDLIGRYGGEEFVVLLPETELEVANLIAERVRKAVEGLRVQTNEGEKGITVSIGICTKTLQTFDLEDMIDCAGEALHQAKQRGRNRIVIESHAQVG